MSRRKSVFGIMAAIVARRRSRRGSRVVVCRRAWFLALLILAWPITARATSIIPISDSELLNRAEVVVRGVVLTSEAREDRLGRPETVSVVRPLEIFKGQLSGNLVLRQTGGVLPDGRFFKLWGRPEYAPGREVIVFAIALPEGDYQTAEMLLGKFEIYRDAIGRRFAVPDLAIGVHPGVQVLGDTPAPSLPRELARFRASLRHPFEQIDTTSPKPNGTLTPVVHPETARSAVKPEWGNISNQLWRWSNNATAAWTLSGTANIDGGGTAEAQGALATWTNNPNSNINYTQGTGTSNVIYLNATSSALGCGWSTCLSGSGVIGCGGPSGGGSNSWRGESYVTITHGTVELRSYCTHNLYSSVVTQSVITHELGHTLGLGHSDQNVSPHDVCRGDEDLATMRSIVQNRTSLGTDDQDAIRWIYGDGGNSCTGAPAPTVSSISPSSGSTTGGTSVTITGANFVSGATVKIGGVAATNVNVASSTSITGTTGPHAAGGVSATVTNPDAQTGTGGTFTYVCGPTPTATVSGGGLICAGTAAQIQAVLTGSPPWNLNWSDGFAQNGVTTSPATRAVNPASTTVYTVTSLTGAFCAGTSSGSAMVTVVSCLGGFPSGTLLPDGRSVHATLNASGDRYQSPARVSASYAAEVETVFDGAGTVSGGGPAPVLSVTRGDGTTALTSAPLDRSACSPGASARLTFTTTAADLSGGPLQVHLSDSASSSGYPFRIRVMETTLYAARWSTNGYSAFIDVQNTSGCPVSGQVVLLNSAGSLVTTLSFSLASRGATQLSVPTGLSASGGSARLTHDGAPDAITAGVYMTSGGSSGAAFRWPFLAMRSYGSSDGK